MAEAFGTEIPKLLVSGLVTPALQSFTRINYILILATRWMLLNRVLLYAY